MKHCRNILLTAGFLFTALLLPSFGYAQQVMPDTGSISAQPDREEQCLKAARYVGAFSGGFMGVAHMYWAATGVSGIHGPMWKNVVTGLPSAVFGSYVGSKTAQWAAKRFMRRKPKLVKSVIKGAGYGTLSGMIIFTASITPILVTGYCMDTIHFNDHDAIGGNPTVLKVLGIAVLGGTLYGGTYGVMVGAAGGPVISWYMEF